VTTATDRDYEPLIGGEHLELDQVFILYTLDVDKGAAPLGYRCHVSPLCVSSLQP